ncbi:hypothetical protein GCHA_2136 [Paraglaciecola chathamensis S18K6]|uniref:Uncharacterized protein n=1 Tax=Paraglaciecola chathamensis S18K6 TaxID=1127672 RepID=A0AAV3UZ55_9ALTE|nr:hypothetical protein GCHA_2136 [Paraglaciecola chathamensis S18K6]
MHWLAVITTNFLLIDSDKKTVAYWQPFFLIQASATRALKYD